ncbi:MAG: phosphoglycerate dehydrogenase [Christensenellaceae bacterium]|nr:phosphoglycerate dehydrogenase [Christensenellaceae bacterium]
MYNIKKLNKISETVYAQLPKDNYLVSSHMEDSDADAFLVRSASCHEMELSDKVLAFARAGAGVNNIPIDKCTDKGIVVFNTPGANANAVKEMVICALLAVSRNIIQGAEWAKTLDPSDPEIAKKVEKGKSQFVGPEIKGKTLGVIGLGAIGVMVANAAHYLDMDVVGYDPYVSVDSAWHLSKSVKRAMTLDELLQVSDYITVHVPLMEKTKNYLSGHEFSKMKEGVYVLNFARGGIVNEQALFDALESGKVAKYITDFPDGELLTHENVVNIPHLGASTPESEENCAVMASRQLREYIEYGSIKNSVNMPECILGPAEHYRIALIHKNLPNMVGQISALVAAKHVNIEQMTNKSKNQIAYTVLDLSEKLDEETLEKLNEIDGMVKIREI